MTEKTQYRDKTARQGSRPTSGRSAKVPSKGSSGQYVIVKPKQTGEKTVVAELARAGVFLAVKKGSKKSRVEQKVRAALKRALPSAATVRAVAKKTEEPPRARLVGAGLVRTGKATRFPWATAQEQDAAIDMAETISSEEIAKRLNTNRETISQWRAGGRLLGVEGAKRGVRYPIAQIGKNLAPLSGIQQVLEAMDGDHWEAWRFLAGEIDELDNATGFDALRAGRIEELLEVLEARANGSFS